MAPRTFMVLLGFLFALVCSAAASAQDGYPRYVPERIERKTETDAEGMLKWAKWASEKCRSCAGKGKTTCKACERLFEEAGCPDCERKEKKEIVCRTCIGEGSLPDPMVKVHCPGCGAAGFLLCTVCNGGGKLRVGGAKRLSACPSCRGDGAFPCQACKGERHIPPASLKPSMAEAELKHLTKALATTTKVLAQLEAFKPGGGDKARKEVKAMAKILKGGEKLYPPLKNMNKQLGKYMGKIFAGKQFVGPEDQEAYAMSRIKGSAEYFLKTQKRMLELAVKRAEDNAKLAADKKGK